VTPSLHQFPWFGSKLDQSFYYFNPEKSNISSTYQI
jgi:hypothetical protein